MKFAVLADIHGNSSALAAVFRDMEQLDISDAVNLGDHFSGPLDALGTAEMLMSRDLVSIRGNHDRWLVESDPTQMGASDEVLLCHGTPASDQTYWLERIEPDGGVRNATIKEIEAEAEGISASLIVCGHTHLPRLVRLRDGRVALNPGSVGCPGYDDVMPVYHRMQTGTPNASYAVAQKSGDDWLVTFRSVPYDNRRMVDLARTNGRNEWASALETGWIDEL